MKKFTQREDGVVFEQEPARGSLKDLLMWEDGVKRSAFLLMYRGGQLWYEVEGKDFVFPVPIDDTGSGTFERDMDAVQLMRWIRIHLQALEVSGDHGVD